MIKLWGVNTRPYVLIYSDGEYFLKRKHYDKQGYLKSEAWVHHPRMMRKDKKQAEKWLWALNNEYERTKVKEDEVEIRL